MLIKSSFMDIVYFSVHLAVVKCMSVYSELTADSSLLVS